MDSAIHWINHCLLGNSIGFSITCPMDKDLSSPLTFKKEITYRPYVLNDN